MGEKSKLSNGTSLLNDGEMEIRRLDLLQQRINLISAGQEILRRTVEVSSEALVKISRAANNGEVKLKDNVLDVLKDSLETAAAGLYEGIKKTRENIEIT